MRSATVTNLQSAILFLLGAWALPVQVEADDPTNELKGVVVEEVGKRSALERAGILIGDILLSWERLPNPPTNPKPDQGEITSEFDWRWLRIEQVPRGTLKLTGQRGAESKVFTVKPGKWNSKIRPRMPGTLLQDYLLGQEHLREGDTSHTEKLWQRVATSEVDWHLRSWIWLRLGDVWAEQKEWDRAHIAYRSGLEASQDTFPQFAFWLAIGDAYVKQNRFEPAKEAFDAAREVRRGFLPGTLEEAIPFNRLGALAFDRRDLEEAEDFYQRALQIQQKLAPDSLAMADNLNNLGIVASNRGDLDQTTGYHQQALEIRQKLAPDSFDVAQSLNNLGAVASSRGDLDQAENLYQTALEIWQELVPGSLDVATCLHNLGGLAEKRGDLDKAADFFQRGLEIRRESAPESIYVAGSLNNIGMLASRRGDLEASMELLLRALEINQKLAPESIDVATNLNNLGNITLDYGDLSRAMDYLQKALVIVQNLAPNSPYVAASLNNVGYTAQLRGDFAKAAELYRRALRIQQKIAPETLGLASMLNNSGLVAWHRGDLELARDLYHRALEIQERLSPDSPNLSVSLINLGAVTSDLGDLKSAKEFYQRSLDIRRKLAAESLDVAIALNNMGALARKDGDLERAEHLHQRALAIFQDKAPSSLRMASSLQNLGNLMRDRLDLNSAKEYYHRALDLLQNLAPLSIDTAMTLHSLGLAYRQEGLSELVIADDFHSRAIEALESQLTRLGASHEVRVNFRTTYHEYYRAAIEAKLELRQPAAAYAVLERSRARSFLEQLSERDTVFNTDIPEELDLERRRLAVRYDRVQAKLSKSTTKDDASQTEELSKLLRQLRHEAKDIEERIRLAAPRLAALQYPQPLDLDASLSVLDPGTLMLSYSIGEESTNLFVVSKNHSLKVCELLIGEQELRQHIEDFQATTYRGAWRRRAASRLEIAKHLYKVLIEPAEYALEQADRILIVPDGPLHRLSFAALVRETEVQRGRSWQYLVEWKPVHSVLSATVYAELKKLRRTDQPAEDSSIALAAFGAPLYPQPLQLANLEDRPDPIRIASLDTVPDIYVRAAAERGSRFPPLPYTRQEVQQIASLYPSARTYLGADATEERAKSIGKDVRILHFATHGTLDDRFPLNSAVALTIPEELPEGRENGLLQAWEIFERVRLDADLVVLSACESALGEEQGGDGLIGLTRAFQYAGARSVAATLWKVADQTTAVLMERFYSYLRAGQSKDEALRAAQLELIRDPIEVQNEEGRWVEKDASAPYYWAAFQIYGDWQ